MTCVHNRGLSSFKMTKNVKQIFSSICILYFKVLLYFMFWSSNTHILYMNEAKIMWTIIILFFCQKKFLLFEKIPNIVHYMNRQLFCLFLGFTAPVIIYFHCMEQSNVNISFDVPLKKNMRLKWNEGEKMTAEFLSL